MQNVSIIPLAELRKVAFAGLAIIGVGYLLREIGLSMTRSLVHPLWLIGLVCVFWGVVRDWQWRSLGGYSRVSTFLLGLACLLWGRSVVEGPFLAIGAIALISWTFAILLEQMPADCSGAFSVLLVVGLALVLVSTMGGYWPMVVRLILWPAA